MKTVTSHSKKESIRDAKHIVSETAKFLTTWTEQQVRAIAVKEHTPYIWPLGQKGYAIGNRRVLNINGYWQVENISRDRIGIFDEKISAVFYCLCEQTGRHRLADSIAANDREVTRLKNDLIHYEASVARAIKNKNSEKIAIWDSRLFDAKIQLKYANDQLQKSLTSAKYIKYWE
jgi:hypothetical protein